MKNKFLKGLVASFALAVSGFANADLIFSEEDLLSSGDGLLIHDHVNNMQWGDWSYTKGYSVDNFFQNSVFAGQGFRLATQSDLELLFSTAGADNITYNANGFSNNFGASNANVAAINLLNSYTEHTISDNWSDTSGNPWIHSFFDNGGSQNDTGYIRFNSQPWSGPEGGIIDIYSIGSYSTSTAYSSSLTSPWSIMIVRDVDPQDVPEPSTIALFALSLMGLASRKYKKQS
ncbi:PEP-CTERM sorting domain-containing protein [Colwellia sp. MEBiC06753]